MNSPRQRTDPEVPPASNPRVVSEVMRPPLTTIDLDSHLAGAAYQIKHGGDTALVVVDGLENNSPVAIVTETDVVSAVADGKNLEQTRLRDVVRSTLVTIEPTATVSSAADKMLAGGFRHLPVVVQGSLVGMVDLVDVCRALVGP